VTQLVGEAISIREWFFMKFRTSKILNFYIQEEIFGILANLEKSRIISKMNPPFETSPNQFFKLAKNDSIKITVNFSVIHSSFYRNFSC
jgi:hypothetical protein